MGDWMIVSWIVTLRGVKEEEEEEKEEEWGFL